MYTVWLQPQYSDAIFTVHILFSQFKNINDFYDTKMGFYFYSFLSIYLLSKRPFDVIGIGIGNGTTVTSVCVKGVCATLFCKCVKFHRDYANQRAIAVVCFKDIEYFYSAKPETKSTFPFSYEMHERKNIYIKLNM